MPKTQDEILVKIVLALDLSDINKPFAKKMDYLSNVWDGTKGKPRPGYWICEVIAANT